MQPVHESFFWRCRGACIALACTALLVSSDQPCVVKTAGTYFVWCMQISVHMRESWSMDCGVFLSIRAPPLSEGGSEGGETLQSVEGVKREEKALREEALR